MNEERKPQYAYSFDEEEYYGKFDSKEEAEAAALEAEKDYECTFAFIGEILSAEQILKRESSTVGWGISNQLVDYIEEFLSEFIHQDTDIVEVSEENKKIFENEVLSSILKNFSFSRYAIEDSTIYTIEIDKTERI